MEALDEAIEIMLGVTALASAIGVTQSAVSNWRARGGVPAEHCPAIERETRKRGRAVVCERLRPDVPWDVLREQSVTEGAPSPEARAA